MTGSRLRAIALTLSLIGGVLFLVVAVLELQGGSVYHTALALGLAVLIVVSGRQNPSTFWNVLLIAVIIGYGVFRLASDLHILGIV